MTRANGDRSLPVPDYSPEFRCVVACLRWPMDAAAAAQVQASGAAVTDWGRFLAIAVRHRVVGLIAHAVAKAALVLPEIDTRDLQDAAASQTLQSMLHAAESIRVDRLLRGSGVAAIFLKGATVTQLVYGRLDLRHAKDVDVLVPEADAERAIAALHAAGYRLLAAEGTLTQEQLRRWLRFGKSMDWVHATTGALLELHWRMSDLQLLQGSLESDRQQQVTLAPGAAVATLDTEHLFAYLCVHGASHGWSRLKWLADVYALLPGDDPARLEAMYRRALELGAGRSAGQALLLCDVLLGLRMPDALRRELQADTVLRMLTRIALGLYTRGDETKEIYDQSFGTSAVYLSRFLLGTGMSAARSELSTLLFPVEQASRSRLPQSLLFLFPIVRASTWVTNRLRHGGRSATV